MTEQTRKKMIFVALGVAIIWGAYNIDIGGGPRQPITDDPSTVDPVGASPVTAAPAKMIDISDHEDRPWGNDPFRIRRAAPARHEAARSWVLSGIVYSPTNPMAVVNRKTVRPGDVVNSARVVSIDKTKVTLDHKGTVVTLTVAAKG